MDTIICSVYEGLLRQQGSSVDDILETPELRNNFLAEVRRIMADDAPERQILHRLTSLRKNGKLLRRSDLKQASPGLFTQDTPAEAVTSTAL